MWAVEQEKKVGHTVFLFAHESTEVLDYKLKKKGRILWQGL